MATQISPTTATPTKRDWSPLIGRCFMNPTLDYLLIGSGLSIPFVIWALLDPSITPATFQTKVIIFLFFNYAHFASSTVRLYTKPGEIPSRAMVSYGLPVIALIITTLCIQWPDILGKHLWSLYLTWSPYHYAAQAYGLALMYCYRSGVILDKTDKKIFWGICMIPFVRAMLQTEPMTGRAEDQAGLGWFVDIAQYPSAIVYLDVASIVLAVLVFALPVLAYFRLGDKGKRLPLIAWMILGTNGLWWVALSYGDAWFWATIFHSLQYLVIVVIVHNKDKMAQSDNKSSPFLNVCWFYLMSIALGLMLFLVWPWMYVPFGFDLEAAILMTVATINLHHFIVDGYIWRSKKKKNANATPAI
ncbi:MAG: hypothetical protein AB8B55_13120 [Mariniblastus sp.]